MDFTEFQLLHQEEEDSMSLNPSLADMRRALALQDFDVAAAHLLMSPRPRPMLRPPERDSTARLGGVLLLLYPSIDAPDIFSVVLTKRADTLANHKGQISLPGGAKEEDETLAQTALREAQEELDIDPATLTVLGNLTTVYILPSDFEVLPLVAYAEVRPDFKANSSEVAEVIEMPLSALLDENIKTVEKWTLQEIEMEMDMPFYQFGEHIIWGATAVILSEFEQRLRQVAAESQSS